MAGVDGWGGETLAVCIVLTPDGVTLFIGTLLKVRRLIFYMEVHTSQLVCGENIMEARRLHGSVRGQCWFVYLIVFHFNGLCR